MDCVVSLWSLGLQSLNCAKPVLQIMQNMVDGQQNVAFYKSEMFLSGDCLGGSSPRALSQWTQSLVWNCVLRERASRV